jgi:hemoglobin-like flavoprotein
MGGAASTRSHLVMPWMPATSSDKTMIALSSGSSFTVEVPPFEKLESLLDNATKSWDMVINNDEYTDSGLKMTGQELFAFVFNEKLNTFNLNEHFTDLMNKSSVKYTVNHAVTTVRFILQLTGKKQTTVSRKLRSIGRDHSGLGMTEDMLEPFLNSILFAIGVRLGEKATNGTVSAWAALLVFIAHGMSMDVRADFDSNTNANDDETVTSLSDKPNSVRRRRSTKEKSGKASTEDANNDFSDVALEIKNVEQVVEVYQPVLLNTTPMIA